MKKAEVIGLGNMGGNMAEVLIKKGYETYVYDVNQAKLDNLVQVGGLALKNAAQSCQKAKTIILSLPNDEIMELVVEEIIALGVEGITIIDTTSAKYTTTVKLAAQVKKNGGKFLDAPVTGGEKGAKDATLTFMVGGDVEAFSSQKPLFEALGAKIVHIGQSGHGQIAKMVNQAVMAAIYCSVTEAFAFAAERGVNIKNVHDAVEDGGAQSALLSAMRETLLTGEPVINGNLAIHAKDVDYVMQEGNRLKSLMPVNSSVQQVMNMARKKGLSNHWSGSMFVMWEELMGIKLIDNIDRNN